MNEPSTWMLALDASTPRCVLALGRVGEGRAVLVAHDDEDEAPNQASVRLVPRIEALLEQAGIEARQLGAVACGRGPGTFTGTRVAVATAKGLAFGVGRGVVPVSTLAAVAASAEHEGAVLALLDARRQEVYGAWWQCGARRGDAIASVRPRGDERVVALATLLEETRPWPADARVVGSGVEPYREALASAGLDGAACPLPGPSAKGLWAAACAAWLDPGPQHPAALDAVYLRASYAEMGIHAPKRPFVKSPFV